MPYVLQCVQYVLTFSLNMNGVFKCVREEQYIWSYHPPCQINTSIVWQETMLWNVVSLSAPCRERLCLCFVTLHPRICFQTSGGETCCRGKGNRCLWARPVWSLPSPYTGINSNLSVSALCACLRWVSELFYLSFSRLCYTVCLVNKYFFFPVWEVPMKRYTEMRCLPLGHWFHITC